MKKRCGEKGFDRVLIHGRTEDGEGLRALRSRPDRFDLAEVRFAREGQCIGDSDLVSLHPTELPLIYDVETIFSRDENPEMKEKSGKVGSISHIGPARIATDAYRRNWEAIFGCGKPVDDTSLN